MSASQNYKLAIARIGTRAIIKFHNEFSGAEFSVGARSGYPDLADCPKCLVSGPYDALVDEGAELLRATRFRRMWPLMSGACTPGGKSPKKWRPLAYPARWRSVFPNARRSLRKTGALGEIRTPGPQIRSLMLYPAELRARNRPGKSAPDQGGEAMGRGPQRQAGSRPPPGPPRPTVARGRIRHQAPGLLCKMR